MLGSLRLVYGDETFLCCEEQLEVEVALLPDPWESEGHRHFHLHQLFQSFRYSDRPLVLLLL